MLKKISMFMNIEKKIKEKSSFRDNNEDYNTFESWMFSLEWVICR